MLTQTHHILHTCSSHLSPPSFPRPRRHLAFWAGILRPTTPPPTPHPRPRPTFCPSPSGLCCPKKPVCAGPLPLSTRASFGQWQESKVGCSLQTRVSGRWVAGAGAPLVRCSRSHSHSHKPQQRQLLAHSFKPGVTGPLLLASGYCTPPLLSSPRPTPRKLLLLNSLATPLSAPLLSCQARPGRSP